MVKTAIEYNDGPIALRYPRGNGYGVPMDKEMKTIPIGSWEILKEGKDVAILTFGTTIPMAMDAAKELEQAGIDVKVVNARFIKPLDVDMLHELLAKKVPILTIEEAVLQGGFGSAVLEFASENKYLDVEIDRMGIPDQFIEQGSVDLLLEEIHLTKEEAVERLRKLANSNKKVGTKLV